jgi:hypothetical protein
LDHCSAISGGFHSEASFVNHKQATACRASHFFLADSHACRQLRTSYRMSRQPLLPSATHKIFAVSFALPRNNSRSIAPRLLDFPIFPSLFSAIE